MVGVTSLAAALGLDGVDEQVVLIDSVLLLQF